jgi:orotate phosphoribosyltransferase
MNFRSIADLRSDIKNYLLPNLPRDVGMVYGIPRSGLLPASIIATALGVDLGMVGGPPLNGVRKDLFVLPKGTKSLLVDDSIFGGGAMRSALSVFRRECYTCAIYAHPKSKHMVNFYAVELPGPRFFEWNFTGIKATEDYMFDMDGVICEDPRVFDDDGSKYQAEIKRVKPLYLPQTKIKAICTNRIERWRPETEAWLKQHGVVYGQLIMQPFATAVERRNQSDPGKYKAAHYSKSDATVFVESHDRQASTIASESKKPVLSIESMKLF